MPKQEYTDADLAAVSDNPEWTEAEIITATPLARRCRISPPLSSAVAVGRALRLH